ncbi:MAG TPA: hypothetical protein VH599_10605 [Ktedonobacterales bacterium]
MLKFFRTWLKGSPLLILALVALAACGSNPAPTTTEVNPQKSGFKFSLVPSSAAITTCLPHASGSARITRGELNEEMTITVNGLAPNTGYDLFVTELPHAPFGIAWYQSDLETNHEGNGSVSVRGIFNEETFSVSQGGPTTTFKATHQFHLGLWFNDPAVPFNLGCEPGKTSPVVTPFNGEQHAGIQVLNTSNFSDDAGPLSKVSA